MKIFIDNRAGLDLEIIARKIKAFLKNHGNFDEYIDIFKIRKKDYKIKYKQNKNSIKVEITNLEIYAKPIKTNDLKFPKLF